MIIKPLTTKVNDRRASGDCGTSGIEFRLAISEKMSKMSQTIRGQGGHFVFPISPKDTNLAEDVEILLPGKFRWISFSGFSEEVENVSANERLGPQFCFSDQPKKKKNNTNFVEDILDLTSCQDLITIQQFQRSWKCLSQSDAGTTILFFQSARKIQT